MQAKMITLGLCAAAATAMLAGTAKAVSLDTLLGAGPNNMIMVGNTVYSNFSYGGILPSNVEINATSAGLAFTNSTGGFTDIANPAVIQYDVTVTGAAVQSVGLDFTATASGGAVADVNETVNDLANGKRYDLPMVVTDGSGPIADNFSSSVTISPASNSLHVVKSIDVSNPGNGTATITLVDNTFTQTGGGTPPPVVPEPMSLALLPLALVGLGLRKKLASR